MSKKSHARAVEICEESIAHYERVIPTATAATQGAGMIGRTNPPQHPLIRILATSATAAAVMVAFVHWLQFFA